MKLLGGILICFFVIACSHEEKINNIQLNRTIHVTKIYYSPLELTKRVSFESHAQHKTYYLGKNVSYNEVEKIRIQLEAVIGKKLKTRGEAHITLVTPPEFDNSLKLQLNRKDIDDLALRFKIQDQDFQPICVGKGVNQKDPSMETYFLVVKFPKGEELRDEINKKVLTKIKSSSFNPSDFYPHITLGFTVRDLHIQDGVKKDVHSCFISLEKHDYETDVD
ncbi:MAG: hypothetical protein KDD45_03820 [Bdellovibrionales bacterium]|nr:hypothetical protein [Bdellovibrionales bacterium]